MDLFCSGNTRKKPSLKTWHIISPCGAGYHHAPACISLRFDDIQCFALMIYTPFGLIFCTAKYIDSFIVCLKIFIKHKIHSIHSVDKQKTKQFIHFLIQLINKKELSISTLSLTLLNELILLSTQFSIYIEECQGIEVMRQNCVERELLIPIVKVIGNLVLDKRDKCLDFILQFVPFALQLNDIELLRCVTWTIDCAASQNYDVYQCIEPCLSIQDIETQTYLLDACVHMSKNNKPIPLQKLIPFMNDNRSRWYIIEIIANELDWMH